MGQCIYVGEPSSPLKPGPVVREMRSEAWMDPAEAGRVLAKDHLLNTNVGVWLYETDVWDKRQLRRRLLALVDYVTAPGFLRHYEEHGKPQLREQRRQLRNLRRRRARAKARLR